jgi:transposase
MTSIAPGTERRKIIVGVDTHKYAHVAVAIDELGVRLGEHHASANREGYARLEAWAASIGRITAWGVEGTGSYGVGLASYLRRNGHRLVEVNRGDRRSRRTNGKTDTLDAEAAARSVLSGEAAAIPKSADGTVEMIRQIKIARDTARKARTAAIVTLKALLVTTPAELREQFDGMTDKVLIARCARSRLHTHRLGQALATHPGPPLPSPRRRDRLPRRHPRRAHHRARSDPSRRVRHRR